MHKSSAAYIDQPAASVFNALQACRGHIIIAAAFSAMVNLLYVAPTIFMLQVYDRVLPTRGLLTLALLITVLVFTLICLSFLDRARSRLLTRAGVVFDAILAKAVLDTMIAEPDAPRSRSGARQLDAIRGTLTGSAMLALFDAPWAPIYIGICFLVHPLIGAMAFGGGIALSGIAWCNERATREGIDRAQDIAARTYASQDAILSAAESVRALGMRKALVEGQLAKREAMLSIQTKTAFHAGNYFTATKFVRLTLQSLALGLGAWLAVDNQISGGAIFASSFLIARALAPIEMLVGSWKALSQARSDVRSIDALLSSAVASRNPTSLPEPRGALSVVGVSVFNSVRDGTVLNGVSFEIAPGEVVAVVGPSGSGKSTLTRVIVGALRPDRGVVRIDGASISDWNPESLARYIGYLPQDSVLFEGTIKENISRFEGALTNYPNSVDAAAVAAADMVGARDLIQQLPGGFDYSLGIGGRGVSAGQAQRIALARAVYREPALLVLDEPNAHLDSDGDAALNNAIVALKAMGKAVLIVSHKVGVLPLVDKILVLNRGEVQVYGPRDQVLARIAPPSLRPS